MCCSSRPCGSAVALRSGPASDQTPLPADRDESWTKNRWRRKDQLRRRSFASLRMTSTKCNASTKCCASALFASQKPLLRIQFDNQLLVHRQLDIFASRQGNHAALVVFAIDLQPHRRRLMTGK